MSAGSGGGAGGGIGAVGAGGTDPESHYGHDGVKVFSHEGEGENTEHLNSMDLHDVKSELERDAEKAETPKNVSTSSGSAVSSATTSANSAAAQIRPVISPPMVYNGVAAPFVMPPFAAAGAPLYNVAGLRPVKMESTDWNKGQMTAIPAYSYPGIVSGLPVDQTGLRPAYPFMIPGQYVQVPYHPQISALGSPVAPNASVQPSSGIVTPTVKEVKRPHIKKPLNAFMLFMKEKRAEVIKQCTLKESAAINQILGKMWHKLDRSEQAKYYEMAREERARHMQMYPGWSARDNYAVHKKRKRKQKKPTQPEEEEPTDPAHPPLSPDPNSRKCRARYGLDQQQMWCGPCRRKKKCIRCSEGDGENAPKPDETPLEDDVMVKDDQNSSSAASNGEVPSLSTTFGALATRQSSDCSNINQSDSTAVTTPPVSLSSQVAAT